MSAEEKVEAVRRWWEELARESMTPTRARDPALDDFVARLHDAEVVVDVSGFAGWPDRPVYRGHEGLRRVLEVWSWSGDRLDFEVEMIDPVGDSVVSSAIQRAHRQGGSTIETRFSTVMTVGDGKVERIGVYSDLEEALRSVGLEV